MDEHILPFERHLINELGQAGLPPLPGRKYSTYQELLVEGHPPRRQDIEEYWVRTYNDLGDPPSGRELLEAKMKGG